MGWIGGLFKDACNSERGELAGLYLRSQGSYTEVSSSIDVIQKHKSLLIIYVIYLFKMKSTMISRTSRNAWYLFSLYTVEQFIVPSEGLSEHWKCTEIGRVLTFYSQMIPSKNSAPRTPAGTLIKTQRLRFLMRITLFRQQIAGVKAQVLTLG